jgi:uncharacterized cupredoxin-like copper-binding protein
MTTPTGKHILQLMLTAWMLTATYALAHDAPAVDRVAKSAAASEAGHAGHAAHAHARGKASPDEETVFGAPGQSSKVARTITVDMSDAMRFAPADIIVTEGETIRFVVRNKGKMMHEMVLGTMAGLKEHGAMMKKHPGMEHDEPYMTHVQPSKAQEMIWQFTKAGTFHYACLLPGHMEAGMIGKITVKPGKEKS